MSSNKDKPKEVLKSRVKSFVYRGGQLVSFVLEGKEKPEQWLGYSDILGMLKDGQQIDAIVDGKTVHLAINQIDKNPEYICTKESKDDLQKQIPVTLTEKHGKDKDGNDVPDTFKANEQIINS